MKFAIIGFGGMGDFHREKAIERYNALDLDEKIEIAGIYDISPERCAYAESLGIRAFASADEIWSDKSIEAVVIATPNDSHLPYVLKAAESGKNIIVEKPAGMSLDEVKQMYDAAEAAGVVFTPHQNRRVDDDYISIGEVIKAGELGECYRIESRVMGANGIPGEWRRIPECGGGMMLDWGVHLIDQMLCLIDGKIKSIYCTYSYQEGEPVEDGFTLDVGFESGLIYRIVVDTNTFIKMPRWRAYCSDGTATVTGWHNMTVEGKTVRCLVRKDDKLEGVSAGNGFTKTMATRRSETVEEKVLEHIKGEKTMIYRTFVDAIRGKGEMCIKRAEIERLFWVMEFAKRSAERNEVIKCLI